MGENIAKNWLTEVEQTVAAKEYDAHMDLISKKVNLFGVPGFDVINYDAWSQQCKFEFEEGLIQSVTYDGLKILATTQTKIMFKTFEIVKGTDGTINQQGIEVLLEKEDDDKWRLVQERILPPEEVEFDRQKS